ncbi:MAG: AraC family transcriptional regulator [Bacillota bacterium]|jgi:AraC-like DNA-binding protein
MLVTEHIREMDENFYLCTYIPIRSVDFNGIPIHSAGYSEIWNELYENQNIFEKAKKKLTALNDTHIVTISYLKHIHFTARQICGKNINRGFHIIGPYTSRREATFGSIVYMPSCCIPYLLELLRIIAADSLYFKQKIKTYYEQPYCLYVKKAIDFMDARYRDPITLEDVSQYLKISKSYLCNLFKKETGKTFSQFLNELRIEKSKKMLLEEDLSVLDIALSVGFNNQNYYNLIFKKLTHRTPLEFKKNTLLQASL